MTEWTLRLPDTLAVFVEQQARRRGFDSVDSYLLDLLRDLQRRESGARLERNLLDGLASGPPARLDDDDWAAIEHEALARVAPEEPPPA